MTPEFCMGCRGAWTPRLLRGLHGDMGHPKMLHGVHRDEVTLQCSIGYMET